MTSPNLPPALIEHLTALSCAQTRPHLKAAQAAMSAIYREGGHSRDAVPNATSALAYALARMPATYAACVRAFDLTATAAPDFSPRHLLDLGAGPGSATLAAAAVWPALTSARLVEPNEQLARLAATVLPAATPLTAVIEPHNLMRLVTSEAAGRAADLVTLSYVLAEQPMAAVSALITRLVPTIAGTIIIVEPGTPAGYARILVARDALVACGLHILAPCPHAAACPLPAGDWCHFSVRLQRSAGHRYLKDADVPFEDERFSFLSASREPMQRRTAARLIRPAAIEKGFADLALCTATGLETRRVKRRDAAAYKAAKGLVWGDEV